MKIVIKKDNRTILHAAFAFWLISEILFEHTIISQTALLLFTGLSVLVVPKIRWPYVLTGYALFVVWSVLNIATGHAISQAVAKAMTRTVIFCLVYLYGFSCYHRYIGNIYEILRIYKWVIAAFSAVCLLGGFVSVLSGERLSTFGINANIIAMQAGYALIITANEILDRSKEKSLTGSILLVALFVLTILFTGSRKGLIIPLLGIYLLVAFHRSGRFLICTVAAAIAGCILLCLLLNVPVLYRLVGYRVEPVLLYLQGADIQEASMETRMKFAELAWEESKKAPIWGHGLDCFRVLRRAYGTYSHCNYVEILFSVGWVGALFYYMPHLYTFANISNALREDRKKTVLLLGLFAPFVLCDFMNVTYFRRISLLIPVMVILSMPQKVKSYENK